MSIHRERHITLRGKITLADLRLVLKEIDDWPDTSLVQPDRGKELDQRDSGLTGSIKIEWRA